MKILFVSNLYPPHYVGGYELRCSRIAAYLKRIGHDVRVVTSSYRPDLNMNGSSGPADVEENVIVERSLCYFPLAPRPRHFYTISLARRHLRDVRTFNRILDDFRPDIITWWNLAGITKTILSIPNHRGIPDIHYLGDNWMVREYGQQGEKETLRWFDFWAGNWGPLLFRPLIRAALAVWPHSLRREGVSTSPFPIRPHHGCFVSEFLRFEHATAGILFPSSEVIYSGISTEDFFTQRAASDFEQAPLKLLYAGFIEPHRSLHTIVEALGLVPVSLRHNIELSIAYTGPEKFGPYVEGIKRRIQELGLSKAVNFIGKVPYTQMPDLYRKHHVLISATTLPEGLPMTLVEAMCAGCAVLTTGSGGAIEIADRADLPIFPKEHPLALGRLIARVAADRRFVADVARRGQEVALREFTFERMVRSFCKTLETVANTRRADFQGEVVRDDDLRSPELR